MRCWIRGSSICHSMKHSPSRAPYPLVTLCATSAPHSPLLVPPPSPRCRCCPPVISPLPSLVRRFPTRPLHPLSLPCPPYRRCSPARCPPSSLPPSPLPHGEALCRPHSPCSCRHPCPLNTSS